MPGPEQETSAANVEIGARAGRAGHGGLRAVRGLRGRTTVAARSPPGYIDGAARAASLAQRSRRAAITPMSLRPSLLDPLFAPVTALPGIGPKVAPLLDRLLGEADRPARVVDLLLHLPE